MAYEDRTRAEKAQLRREAAERAKVDDRHNKYEVITEKGTRLTCAGEIDAKILAGKGGSYKRK